MFIGMNLFRRAAVWALRAPSSAPPRANACCLPGRQQHHVGSAFVANFPGNRAGRHHQDVNIVANSRAIDHVFIHDQVTAGLINGSYLSSEGRFIAITAVG